MVYGLHRLGTRWGRERPDTRIECWLYPRQAEGRALYNNETLYDDKHGDNPVWGVPTKSFGEKSPRYAAPWRFAYTDDMTDNRGWFDLPEIPRGDPYHQGEIHIRGLVNYSDDIGKEVLPRMANGVRQRGPELS